MKSLVPFLTAPMWLIMPNAYAQADAHLKLSKQYPAAGEKLKLVYDATGTPLNAKKDITATVYFLDHKSYPAADIALKPDGKTWNGEFTVDNTARAFFIKVNSGKVVDDNGGKGYVYIVYKNDWPVAGAYAEKAALLTEMGSELANIKKDKTTAITLYNQEFKIYPQSEKDYEADYYNLLAPRAVDAPIVAKKIALLEKGSEKDQMLAANLFIVMKKKKQADSLTATIKAKFPHGKLVEDTEVGSIYDATSAAKKAAIFNDYNKYYPANTERGDERDNLLQDIAMAYLAADDVAGFDKYAAQMKKKFELASSLDENARRWALKGIRLDDAEKLSKESLTLTAQKISKPVASPYTTPTQAKKDALYDYDQFSDTYAMVLLKKGKAAEALTVEQKVYNNHNITTPTFYDDYLLILKANAKYARAQQVAAERIKAGMRSPGINAALKECYAKVKGNMAGYTEYLAGLEAEGIVNKRDELAKTMINQPAPQFTLKGLDGKAVSLAALKGKVVVVDFWATWCGPCKASMPGMQLAVNKYKNDPNVQFLFIDCWENGEPATYVPGVKKFIGGAKYSFHVLVDEKDADGRQGKVVGAYGVDGIPTKFVVDKKGNIRFKYVGYNGTPDGVLNEVSAMVDLAGR